MLLLIVIFNSENEKTNKENIFDQDTVKHRLSRLSSLVLVFFMNANKQQKWNNIV